MIIEQKRYVAVAKGRILCVKGWIPIDNLKSNQVKLFQTPSHIEQHFEEGRKTYGKPKYEIKKVKVKMEVFEWQNKEV